MGNYISLISYTKWIKKLVEWKSKIENSEKIAEEQDTYPRPDSFFNFGQHWFGQPSTSANARCIIGDKSEEVSGTSNTNKSIYQHLVSNNIVFVNENNSLDRTSKFHCIR